MENENISVNNFGIHAKKCCSKNDEYISWNNLGQ